MIKLKSLTLTNFRSWKELYIDFETMNNLILLKGLNGSGKTSIRYAIELLFLGTTIDNIPVDELSKNKSGNYRLSCELVIEDKNVIIINERVKNKPSITYFINGKPIPEKTDVRETQKDIIKMLGLDKVDLNSSTIFSTNSLSFPELPDGNRKSLIYDVLELNKYNDYLAKVKEELKELKDKVDKYNNKIATSEGITESHKDELLVYRIKSNSFEEDREDDLFSLTGKLGGITGNILKYKLNIREIDDKIEKLNETTKPIDEKYIAELEDLIVNKLGGILIELYTKRKGMVESIEKLGDGTCPILKTSCDTLLKSTEDVKDDYNTELINIDLEIKDKDDRLKHYKNALDFIIITQDKNNNISDKIDTLEYDKKDIESEMYRLDIQKENIEVSISETQQRENVYKGLVEDCLKLITEREKTINRLNSAVDKLKENTKYYKVLEVAFGKSGIPNMICDGFLASLEFETNKILSNCSDGISVSIDSLSEKKDGSFSEKISYTINIPDKEISDYRSFSGGQRQRIRVANTISFNKLLSNFDFIIFDEILDSALDEEGKSDIINILKSNDIKHTMVISHSTQLQDIFDEVIEIEIENGVSKLSS